MLLFKHKSYHKLQIYAYMISWLRVLELENTKGLMNLRKRLGMSFKCWLRQWPFKDKVSPALESSPSLGEGRRQRGLDPAQVSGRSRGTAAAGDHLRLPAPGAGASPRRTPAEPPQPLASPPSQGWLWGGSQQRRTREFKAGEKKKKKIQKKF